MYVSVAGLRVQSERAHEFVLAFPLDGAMRLERLERLHTFEVVAR